MKTTKQHKVWIILLLILLPTFLLNGQILFKKKISIDDGLAYSQVLCGIVDDEGYFWFGTSSGLSRWDGNNFQNFYISNGLISNHIKEILWHKTFGLIIATQNGVNFLKNGEIITPENYPQKLFTRINYLLSYKNKLLIATNNYGLWEYDGKIFNQILIINGDENLSVYTLFTNNKDEILVGTENGLFTFKNNTLSKNNKYIFPKKVTITSLNQDETGRLIVGTIANGIFIFSKKEVTNINKYNGLPTNRINNITKGAGTLWYIATDEGAAVLDKNKIVKYYNTNSGLETDFIWNILKYKDYYYFLTDGSGFYQYAPDRFEYYNTSSGLPNNTVWNFEELNDGSICLTTDNGIAIIREKGIQNLRTNKEVRDDIIDVFESANGTLFFGTNNNGVAIYDNNVFSFINQSNGLTSSAVWSITDDKNGYLYFSTFNGGICVYKNGSIIDTIDINDGLPNNNILTSFTSEDGTLYFSVDGEGVFTYKDKDIKPFCTKLSKNIIWSIAEDSEGNLFFGSNNLGLFIYHKDGTIDTLSVSDGLTNNSVVGLTIGDSGNIYASTDKGLNIITKKDEGFYIRQMLNSDGLPSNECNQNAIYNDSKGNIWVGTIKGAIKYSPINDKKSLNPPMLNISSVKLFNEKIDFFNKIKLNYNQNYLSFEFTGIDFSAPHKVKYAYKMQGVDDDWIVTKRNFVQYTNLNNGQYLLQVKAANEWGIWSEPKSLQFTILPAFWETWWFITLIILTVTGTIVWIATNKVKHLIAIERLRSNISADLHDDIGSGLSEVSLLSEIINYKLSKNEVKKISSELNKIGNISREIIESMSDIVWFVNPKNDSLFDLISRLGDAYHVTLSSKNILLDLQNIDLLQKINLSMEYRQNLYLLIKEGINNSLKYSKCSKITLNTNVKGKILTINLTDNGIGFDSEKILKGNGLKNMKIRSKKLGGKIEIISIIGNGTQIIFSGKITN